MTIRFPALVGSLDGHGPDVAEGAWIAPTAVVIGRVRIGAGAGIWYGCVLRGDDDDIVIGAQTNVQDGCIVHADPGEPSTIGAGVSLGHGAIVHGATVEDGVLVGMRATVLGGACIGSGSLVAAGAVVRPGFRVPPGSLVAGVPARVVRPVTDAEARMIHDNADIYRLKAERHRSAVFRAWAQDGGGDRPG